MSEAVTVSDLPAIAAPENSTPDSFAVRGFQKGYDPRRNLAGRIKKAPTVLDETQKLAERAKNRKRIAKAWVETMATADTAVGQRARADYRDTFHGVPKQTLVVSQGESQANELDAELAAYLASKTVDGESRRIT